MNFLKKNICFLSLLGTLGVCVFVPDAYATVMDTARNKAGEVFRAVKSIIFVVGGFGLVALAFFAIFGKLKWTWFASLAVGLAILAAAGAIVDYATGTIVHTGSDVMDDSIVGTATTTTVIGKK